MNLEQVQKDLRNVAENAPWCGRVDTISALVGRGKSKVAVMGAGATLEELQGWRPDKETLVIANQSSAPYLVWAGVPVDVVMVSDTSDATYARLEPILNRGDTRSIKWVVASKVSPKLWRALLVRHTFYYHAVYGGQGEAAEVYNMAVRTMFNDRSVPFFAQVGSVVNASVILAAWMQPKDRGLKVYLGGCDFGYPRWPRMRAPRVYEDEGLLTLEVEDEVLNEEEREGKFSVRHRIYGEQNRLLREIFGKEGVEFFTMNHNELEKEIPWGRP